MLFSHMENISNQNIYHMQKDILLGFTKLYFIACHLNTNFDILYSG